MFELVDHAEGNLVSHDEFVRAMEGTLHFDGPRETLDAIYEALDDDSSGTITFEEVGQAHRTERCMQVAPQPALRLAARDTAASIPPRCAHCACVTLRS